MCVLIQSSYFSLLHLFFCFVASSRKDEAAGSDFLRHPPHVFSGRHHGAVPHWPVAPGLPRTLPLLYERQSHTGIVLQSLNLVKMIKQLFKLDDICPLKTNGTLRVPDLLLYFDIIAPPPPPLPLFYPDGFSEFETLSGFLRKRVQAALGFHSIVAPYFSHVICEKTASEMIPSLPPDSALADTV